MPYNLDADLSLVREDWREPLLNHREGIVPRSNGLRAILIDDIDRALSIVDDAREVLYAIRFIDRHLPPFSHGSPAAVANWEFLHRMLNQPSDTTSGGDFVGGGG
jgi:hypothetical protein